MKKKLFYAVVAIGMLASCAENEYVGEVSPNLATDGTDAIVFNSGTNILTRADQVGATAAATLQNQFVVYGIKHASDEVGAATNDEVVFRNYVVEYADNTAGTVMSNTHNWDYVGITPYASTKVSPTVTSQGIKYWDYSAASGYTFYAFASKSDLTNDKVTVTKTTAGTTVYDKGYTVKIKTGANLDNLYVADRMPVAKTNYGAPVTLTFRNFGARVRVGFYETIPGYKVTINKFYVDGDASAAVTTFGAMDVANTTNFAASLQNINKSATENELTVTYYDNTVSAIENHAKLTPSTVGYNYSLVLGSGVVGTDLATSSATPTWDNSGNYTTVYPFEGNTNPMLIKVDYTLTALDVNEGAETIEVKGANVVVPTQYVQWKSNFAYTYIFKISDNSNGYTGASTDPQGLFPITFDAVVVAVEDDKTQETITNFEDYSITTYANGSKVTVNNEYKKGEAIYVVKMENSSNAVVAHTAIGESAGNAQVYTATTSGDAISEATVKARLTGSPNGITLTAVDPAAVFEQNVPAADGTTYDFGAKGSVKFTPGAAGTYVYVSTRTAYVAPTYAAVGSAAYAAGTYYFKNTVGGVDYYYAAAGINEGNFEANKANLYTQSTTGTAGEYDIKVIKVVN